MLAHQPLGELGVPRLQRLDDVHVIDDGAVGAVLSEMVRARIERMWMKRPVAPSP